MCLFRRRAGAGGEATLAVQRLPAGAERVPAAAAQTTQVPLHRHVTHDPGGTPSTCVGRRGGREKTVGLLVGDVRFLFVLLDETLIRSGKEKIMKKQTIG